MDHRLGKCSDCGAEYKIPASFPHDVARCKVCSGTVRLGAPGGNPPAEAPKEMPARKVAPPAAAAPSAGASEAPKKKKGDTLARLKAQRQAAAEPAKKAAAPRTAAKAPARAKPAPAAKAAASAKPTRAAGAGARRRSAAKDDDSAGKSSRRPRREAKPKKAPVGSLIGIGVLLLLVAGFFFKDTLFGDDSAEVAAQGSNNETEGDAGLGEGADAAAATEETVPDEDPIEDDVPEVPEDDAAPDPAEEADATPAEKPTPKLSDIDLSEFNFGPDKGVSDDEWEEMNGWMATWMDVDAGAAGNRSKLKLLEKKRAAVPVILNYMKTLDFTTEEGKSNGDQCQKGLTEILNGANFSWKYTTSEEDAYFNKGVVRNFCLIWEKASDNLEYWIKTAKLEERDPEEADRLRELWGIDGGSDEDETPPPAFEDDDLDVD